MSYEAHRQLSVPFRATSAHRGPVIADLRHNTAKRYTFFLVLPASSPTGMSSGYVIGTDVPAAQSTRNGVSVRFMFVKDSWIWRRLEMVCACLSLCGCMW